MTRSVRVGIVIVVTALMLGLGSFAALRIVRKVAEPLGRPDCSTAEEAFAQRLGTDAMVTQAPAGLTIAASLHAQPCVSLSESDWIGGAATAWGSPSDALPPDDQLLTFYEDLAQAQGWQLAPEDRHGCCGAEPRWVKTVDGRSVEFSLSLRDQYKGRPAYWARITYDGPVDQT